jgi:hypothetical protein
MTQKASQGTWRSVTPGQLLALSHLPNKRITKDWLNPSDVDCVREARGLPVWPGNRMPAPLTFDATALTRKLTITWDDCEDNKKVKTDVKLTK